MRSTKEQIQKAAMQSFRNEEVSIGSAKATIRELSAAERKELNARLYVTDSGSGEPALHNADGQLDPNGDQWMPRDGVKYFEEWIAATIEPAFTVDEIVEWPDSLKRSLCGQARRINGIEPAESVAKNS